MTAVLPPLVTVSWDAPPSPSPREILSGVTQAGVVTAPTICARPAPCRHVASSSPEVGAMLTALGSAVFMRSVLTSAGEIFSSFAWRISAASPATCGAAIEVPLIVLWPPNCWCGQVE